MDVPIDQIRNASALLFGLAGIGLLTTRIRDLAKATILVGPLTTFQITVFFQLYLRPFLALGITLLLAGVCLILIRWIRKPWFYYLAVGLSTLVAVLYAWPVP
jgi:hypothetical protein